MQSKLEAAPTGQVTLFFPYVAGTQDVSELRLRTIASDYTRPSDVTLHTFSMKDILSCLRSICL